MIVDPRLVLASSSALISSLGTPKTIHSLSTQHRSGILELQWFCNLLCDLGVRLPKAPTILTDSKSVIFMVDNLVIRANSCHIELNCHYVQDFIAKKLLQIRYTPNRAQTMDIFMKALPTEVFLLHHRSLILIDKLPLSLTGGNRE